VHNVENALNKKKRLAAKGGPPLKQNENRPRFCPKLLLFECQWSGKLFTVLTTILCKNIGNFPQQIADKAGLS
jgi:hypothetical protein